MTSILPLAVPPSIAALAQPVELDSALPAAPASGWTDRDAMIPDLADTSSELNQLQSLSAMPSTIPAPTLPTTQQQTQAQQAAALPPLKQDFYADGDDGE
ncbi:MAG TPA: hypothetical protein VGP41_04835 [Candidatus Lustribacter sp.]|nr:hypothetical protein [Candidatus Lustribacter sp.]